jgi:ADP-ribosylglycohydrolase
MAYWTLECALADGGLDIEHLAEVFCSRQIYGIGSAVREFRDHYGQGVRPWYRCAPQSAGNGALMRIAPVLIPHLETQTAGLWADAALAATLTHNDATSTAACVAWVHLLWSLLGMRHPPEPAWWTETFISVAGRLEGETVLSPRGGDYVGYRGPLWRFVEQHVERAFREELTAEAACNRWYSGAFLPETVPSALYILMRHGHDPEEAILRAVNDIWDNDTAAAIVGGAVGALHGAKALPAAWRRDLTGRTGADDDGRMQQLLESAARAFGPV